MPIKQKDLALRKSRPAAVAPRSGDGPSPAAAQEPDVFADPRSGNDRRRGRGSIDDSRRGSGERRRSRPGGAWWLGRNYVESHYVSMTPTPHKSPEHE
jgi:hypothetical protein